MNHLTQTRVSISFRAPLADVIYFKTMEKKKKRKLGKEEIKVRSDKESTKEKLQSMKQKLGLWESQ